MTPRVTVVMAVFNGAPRLSSTLDSILQQTLTDLEVVVINDGSTDGTQEILDRYRDSRIRVFSQENLGLTRSLIRGCELARGSVIARQDCGDRSHAERLSKQLAVLDREDDVVLVSCHTSFHAPDGELLYVAAGEGENVRRSLRSDDATSVRGLSHHGSAMFRRDVYLQAGGYRSQFRVAQDLDLWVRMAALGRIAFVPEILYEATMDLHSISARYRDAQFSAASIAVRSRDGEKLEDLFTSQETGPPASVHAVRRSEADALYFIASCLKRRRDPRWISYTRRALRRNPLLFRAWFLFVRVLR